MEACMAYAAEHATAVEQAHWDLRIAGVDKTQAAADFFPSVSAASGVQWGWGRNIDPETNSYNDVTTFSNSYSAGMNLTVLDGGRTVNRWKQARLACRIGKTALQGRRDDAAIAAMMAFADAVYQGGAVSIAADRLRTSQGTLRLVEEEYSLGTKGLPDVATARAAVANDSYVLVHQRNLYDQALLTLKTSMNFPVESILVPDTSFRFIKPELMLDDAEAVYAYAMETNPRALVSRMTVENAKLDVRLAQGEMWPTVNVSAGISTSYYRNLTAGAGAPFGEQFRNNRGEYVSASISIPLFDNLRRTSSLRRSRFAHERARVTHDENLRRLHDDIAAAIMDRDGYAMEIQSLEAKTEADSLAFELNARLYREGLISLTDYQTSASAYFDSRLTLLQRRMLYVLKERMVAYYKGEPLIP